MKILNKIAWKIAFSIKPKHDHDHVKDFWNSMKKSKNLIPNINLNLPSKDPCVIVLDCTFIINDPNTNTFFMKLTY